MSNGDLLDIAESEGYELLITTDRNMRHQQNLAGRRLAVIVLLSGAWPYARSRIKEIRAAVAEVAGNRAYQNAMANSDKQNARIEHDKALEQAMTELLADHTELFKQFSDNESFRRWLSEMVFAATYDRDMALSVSQTQE